VLLRHFDDALVRCNADSARRQGARVEAIDGAVLADVKHTLRHRRRPLMLAAVSYYELTDHFEVRSDLPTTWRFFSAVDNLAKITPPWLAFTVRTNGPVELRAGALLDYTIKWIGLPIKWRTRIIDWSPPRQFIDIQLRGPYTLWHHQHVFTPSKGGVECQDRVIYKLPVALVAPLVHAMVVKKQLMEIFQFRRKVIAEELGWVRAVQEDVRIVKL
jgi:ligand-binding SRPBCC domain-containing protein